MADYSANIAVAVTNLKQVKSLMTAVENISKGIDELNKKSMKAGLEETVKAAKELSYQEKYMLGIKKKIKSDDKEIIKLGKEILQTTKAEGNEAKKTLAFETKRIQVASRMQQLRRQTNRLQESELDTSKLYAQFQKAANEETKLLNKARNSSLQAFKNEATLTQNIINKMKEQLRLGKEISSERERGWAQWNKDISKAYNNYKKGILAARREEVELIKQAGQFQRNNAAREAQDLKRNSGLRKKAGGLMSRTDKAWGSPVDKAVTGATNATLRGLSMGGVLAATQAISGMQAMQLEALSKVPSWMPGVGAAIDGLNGPLAQAIKLIGEFTGQWGLAAVAAAAFAPWIPTIARGVIKGIQPIGQLGKVLAEYTDIAGHAAGATKHLKMSWNNLVSVNPAALQGWNLGKDTSFKMDKPTGLNAVLASQSKFEEAFKGKLLDKYVVELEKAIQKNLAFKHTLDAVTESMNKQKAAAAQSAISDIVNATEQLVDVERRLGDQALQNTEELLRQENVRHDQKMANWKKEMDLEGEMFERQVKWGKGKHGPHTDMSIRGKRSSFFPAGPVDLGADRAAANAIAKRRQELEAIHLINKKNVAVQHSWWKLLTQTAKVERSRLVSARVKNELVQKRLDKYKAELLLAKAITKSQKNTMMEQISKEGFGESFALGVGFPLMFGAGPTSVAGSAIGSLFGKGFGGQILGGAIGQMFDDAIVKAGELGNALEALDMSALRESGIRITGELEAQLQLLREQGEFRKAEWELQKKVANTTGAIPGTHKNIALAVDFLGNTWKEFMAAVSTTLGILGTPFVAALGLIIKLVNVILQSFNFTASLVGGLLYKLGQLAAYMVGGQAAVDELDKGAQALNAQLDESVKNAILKNAELEHELQLVKAIARYQVHMTPGRTPEQKKTNIKVKRQIALTQLEAERDNKIRELNAGKTNANKDVVDESIRKVKTIHEIKESQIYRDAERELQENERAAADYVLDRAMKAESIRRKGLALNRQIADLNLSIADKAYNLKKQAAAMEREGAQLRKSIEDEIWKKRMQILKLQSDAIRKQQQLTINQTSLDMERLISFTGAPGEDVANGLVRAAQAYIRTRAEGEANLQAKERQLAIKIETIRRQSDEFELKVGQKVSDMSRSAAEFDRNVERGKLIAERSIYDMRMKAADYDVEMTLYRINLEEKERNKKITQLAGQTTGIKMGSTGRSSAPHFHIQRTDGSKLSEDTARGILDPAVRSQVTTTDSYGDRGGRHKGVDLAGEAGTPLNLAPGYSVQELMPNFGPNAGNAVLVVGPAGSFWVMHLQDLGGVKIPDVRVGGAELHRPTRPEISTLTAAKSALDVKAPGGPNVSGLLGNLQQSTEALIEANRQSFNLEKSLEALSDEERGVKFGQAVKQSITQINKPMDDLINGQIANLDAAHEYQDLISKGISPALAEELMTINEIEQAQLATNQLSIDRYTQMVNTLDIEEKQKQELIDKIELLKQQNSLIGGRADEARGNAKKSQSPGERMRSEIAEMTGELDVMLDPVNQVVVAANAIGDAFSQAFSDVVSGSKSAEEAMGAMLEQIGQHFIDYAATLIAQMALIAIAKAAASMFSGPSPGGIPKADPLRVADGFHGPAFADGGRPPVGRASLVGERGPELFLPDQPGTIVPNHLLSTYSPGNNSSAGGTGPINVSYNGPQLNFNGDEYVPKSAVPELIATAARQGAKQGQAMTMSGLRNSRSQRSRVGL